MVKLLGIVGSPRKSGNTETLMEETLKSAEQEGAEIELIRLVDFNLKPCDGCQTCTKTKKCAIEDDVESIFKKMAEADGIIIGSPVYFQNVTAQTKIFMDRVGYLNIARGRRAFENKIGGAIVVARRAGLSNALSQIFLFLNATRMVAATPAVRALASSKGDVIKDTEGMRSAGELGKSMVRVAKATASLR